MSAAGALRSACIAADVEAAKAAIQQEPESIDAKDPETQWTCLHAATKAGSVEIVKALIAAKADVEAKTHHDSTALHMAACNGLDKIAFEMIKAGCPLEAKDNKGNTALVRSGQHGHSGVAALLLASGADTESRNVDGQTVESRAKDGGHEAVLHILSGFKNPWRDPPTKRAKPSDT
mmetsp:Transcript_28669/g.52209  ORF Transcript_28669/g.52209 Transcript_28669/m.52209 type:complete len:177 (-) Transcript_28669:35-565(-)